MTTAILAYLSLVVAMSVASFAVYWSDKRRAINGGRRIPERTLHVLAFLGGWPGALMGQRHFHHKTKKMSFLIVFWSLVLLHVAIVATVMKVVHGSLQAEVDKGTQAKTQ